MYMSDLANVETLRIANAKAKAPRRPENMIIICQRQLIGVLRVKLSKNDRNTTHNTRANAIAI